MALCLAIICFFASGILFLTAITAGNVILLSGSSTTTVGTLTECTNGTCTTVTNYPMIEGHESFISSWAVDVLASLLVLVGLVILAFGLSHGVMPPPVVGQTYGSPVNGTEPWRTIVRTHQNRRA